MDGTLFYNSFQFTQYIYKNSQHTDNSDGIKDHFVARICEGSARIVTQAGEVLTVEKGEVFYLPAGLRYRSYWYSEKGGRVLFESYRFSAFPCDPEKRYAMQKLSVGAETLGYLDKLAEDKTVSATSVGYLYLFLGGALPNMEEVDVSPQDKLLGIAKQYMTEMPNMRVSELARRCGMSESGLYAFFKKYAHVTPIEMKNRIQIEKAVALLLSTDLTIEEISGRVGYGSVAYFRKIFIEQTGKTPSGIRNDRKFKDTL